MKKMIKKIRDMLDYWKESKQEIIIFLSIFIILCGAIYYVVYVKVDSRDCRQICRLNNTDVALVSSRYGCVCENGRVYN